MNPVYIFCEGKIDGENFLIFTLQSEKDSPSSSFNGEGAGPVLKSSEYWEAGSNDFSGSTQGRDCEGAIDSGGDYAFPLQPLFLCPYFRFRIDDYKKHRTTFRPTDFIRLSVPPHFSCQKFEGVPYPKMCKLPLLPLFWCNNEIPSSSELHCSTCKFKELYTFYYLCVGCDRIYHKECVESPLEIKHPSYPFISLQLYNSNYSKECFCCKKRTRGLFYHCPTNHFSISSCCALKPIPLVINHPKRHLHPLSLFPKQALLPCNICGLTKPLIPTYVCLQCFFVFHKDCLYFPQVIRISRHQHRISLTYSLPSGKWSCGVCRKKVDENYGAYSCNTCSGYFVHSRCALREDLWDGKELEGVPEEPEIVVEPFKIIADGIILHFSHEHHLKLNNCKIYDEDKFCHACLLSTYGGNYYSCMVQCDFILHETCANDPLKKHHPLHAFSLMLNVESDFYCDACDRFCRSFSYKDPTVADKKKRDLAGNFVLDLKCASICEPFKYEGHEHSLYLALTREEEKSASCQICQLSDHNRRKLKCIECDFIICFWCATLPFKARYKHDKHFLTFYEDKEKNNHSEWCDVCEKTIADSENKGFYSCDECRTTLHIECLLGEFMSIKPGCVAEFGSRTVNVIRNNTMSRPICFHCNQHCSSKVFLQFENNVFCSLFCLPRRDAFDR